MPRYIDAKKIRYCWMYDADGKEHDGVTLQSVIDKVPTEDVAPRAEVAREIFEEIERYINDEDILFLNVWHRVAFLGKLAKLKKKYTGE